MADKYKSRSCAASSKREPLNHCDKEWLDFCERIGASSDSKAIDYIEAHFPHVGRLDRKDISAFRQFKGRNNTELKPEFARLMSEVLGVRAEYLLGHDNYRTEADYLLAQKEKENIFSAVHTLLVNLGYADLDIDCGDFNLTMPSNTQEFLRKRSEQRKIGENIICDVNADKYVDLSFETYSELVKGIASYTNDLIQKLMNTEIAHTIPDQSTEDKVFLPANFDIELKANENGVEETLAFKNIYAPTNQLDYLFNICGTNIEYKIKETPSTNEGAVLI